MKRSEMILRLVDQLQYVCDDTNGHVSKLDAKEFLDFLEELGMQPPLSEVKLVPDPTRKGTLMHTELKREWDEE